MNYRLSQHAREELVTRQIPEAFVAQVMSSPQQVVVERLGRKVYQSKVDFGGGRVFLLRVVVKDTIDPAIVITVYRTSKISKYWQ